MKIKMWNAPFYIMRHPLEGFDDVHAHQTISLAVSMALMVLLALMQVLSAEMIGGQFRIVEAGDVNFPVVFFSGFLLLFIWTISNWCFCVLMDGKARLKTIWIISAYSLLPYTICGYINILLGLILTREEGVFRTFVTVVGVLWSLILLVSAFVNFHEFSVGKSLVAIVITFVGMVIIAVLIFLLYSLLQQMVSNTLLLINEIILRRQLGG